MSRLSMSVALAIIMIATVVAAQLSSPLPCSWTAPDGTNYDLSPLYQGGNTQYKGQDAYYTYSFNVCGRSLDTTCNGIGCQYDSQGQKIATLAAAEPVGAQWSTITGGVQLLYTNGDPCWMMGTLQTRIVKFQFVCSATNTTIATVIESPTCTFTITLPTPWACSSRPITDTCVYKHAPTGLLWNLTSLTTTRDLMFKPPGSVTQYSLALCGGSSQVTTPCGRNKNSGCAWDVSGFFLLGMGGTQVTPPGQWNLINDQHPSTGVEQSFANGESCLTSTGARVPAKLVIRYYCDPKGTPSQYMMRANDATCTYTWTFVVAQGCPQ